MVVVIAACSEPQSTPDASIDAEVGADALVTGVCPGGYRDEIKFLNDNDRKWILGGTALKLWPFA